MKPYSQDIREKIIRALETQEESQAEIAERFDVSISFVEKLWYRWRTIGSCAALPHAGGRKRSLQEHQESICTEVAKQPDITLQELCDTVVESGGRRVSVKTMCLELKRLKLPRKKSHSTTVSAIPQG
jgi:transposase